MQALHDVDPHDVQALHGVEVHGVQVLYDEVLHDDHRDLPVLRMLAYDDHVPTIIRHHDERHMAYEELPCDEVGMVQDLRGRSGILLLLFLPSNRRHGVDLPSRAHIPSNMVYSQHVVR